MMRKLAVIGSPVEHSRSPFIHNAFAARMGLDYAYSAVEVTRDTLPEFVQRARAGEYAGFNVTMPLKEEILHHLAEIDGAARACGSVNTVVVRNGELHGYSTDGVGVIAALHEKISDLRGKTAVILGTGGAAKSAAYALNVAGTAVTALSRRDVLPRVEGAATRPWAEFPTLARDADIVVNATPIGMAHNAETDAFFENFEWLDALKRGAVVFDIVYNPLVTRLLYETAARNIAVIGGLPVLIYQAAAAFEIFTGYAVPDDVVQNVKDAL
ncbi:MAG: shikimate dehydrogenase [Oscillospiraceae bacterium]|jgi:shikimate dehydrogenase|nr:shikimate dehydrogenase [Oscillospiraceae bacterium]